MTDQPKPRTCAWCGNKTVAVRKTKAGPQGPINEYRCPDCHNIVAAYLQDAGDVLPRIRAYANPNTEA